MLLKGHSVLNMLYKFTNMCKHAFYFRTSSLGSRSGGGEGSEGYDVGLGNIISIITYFTRTGSQ